MYNFIYDINKNLKMETYNQLSKEFDKKVKELQSKCPHKKTYWAEHYWALAHSSGYKVRVCNRCRKILEEKPTEEEREKAQEEWFKKQERFDKKADKEVHEAKELNKKAREVVKRAKKLFLT